MEKASKTHILIVCQYFYPEQFRINDIAQEWIKRGYQVTVLTGIPNYPQGKFYPGYGLHKKRRETWNGIEIIRIPLIPRGSNKIGLILNYYSFPVFGWFWNLTTRLKADMVFMFETSPMNQCKIGVKYAKKHKVPCYLYVQDLWPENVQIVTGINNKLIIGAIDKMVRRIYKGCTHIFATSPSFVKMIQAKTATPVSFLPQYAEEIYSPEEKPPRADGRFRIVFTGNIGQAQGLGILPKAAKLLKEAKQDVEFVIVGEGRAKFAFLDAINGNDVKEMFTLIGQRPAAEIAGILARCDMGFISFEPNDLWKATIPAKLQSYMACGIPVLAVAEGETERVINQARCGFCSPVGDEKALADLIGKLMQEKWNDLPAMGMAGATYCRDHFNKEKLLDEMDEVFWRGLQKSVTE